jgi:hypothetical protein
MTDIHSKNVNQSCKKGINLPFADKEIKKKSRGSRNDKKVVEFVLAGVYTLDETARILRRTPATIRKMANMEQIQYRKDGAGYLFTGWSIKNYAEGRAVV